MEQTFILPDLGCDACNAVIVKGDQIITPYFHLVKRGIYVNYYFYICKICYEAKHKHYTLKAGYTIFKEYPVNEL